MRSCGARRGHAFVSWVNRVSGYSRLSVALIFATTIGACHTSSRSDGSPPPPANPELKRVFEEDQAARAGPIEGVEMEALAHEDSAHRIRVRELAANGALQTAKDFYHAAMRPRAGLWPPRGTAIRCREAFPSGSGLRPRDKEELGEFACTPSTQHRSQTRNACTEASERSPRSVLAWIRSIGDQVHRNRIRFVGATPLPPAP